MTTALLAELQALAKRPGGWTGTASDLLVALAPATRPADATRLAGLLRACVRGLAGFGVVVTMRREAKTVRRLLALAWDTTCGALPAPCAPPPPAPPPLPLPPDPPPLWPYGARGDAAAHGWREAMRPAGGR